MVETLRTCGHQLADPGFDDPQQLVSYMGAVQGQDLEMCKWAVGMRLRQPSLSNVRETMDSGRIIRTHILRPTWHLVSAKDIRWMLETCGDRLRAAYMTSWGKHYGIDENDHSRFRDGVAKLLAGTDGLTMQELTAALNGAGHAWNQDQVKTMLSIGEVEGLVCNGREKNRKHTYALLDERVPAAAGISREEALSRLAVKYFRSHSPASLEDFMWWSGMSGPEARAAIASLRHELIADRYEDRKLFVHESCVDGSAPDDEVHLLPPYDEYLISYRDRTHVLDPKYSSKAHNNFGIFHPVILYKGRISATGKKRQKKASSGSKPPSSPRPVRPANEKSRLQQTGISTF